MEMEDAGVLPEKKQRNPIIYVVLHTTDEGLKAVECDTRGDAKRFINSLSDPSQVLKVYRVSAVIKPQLSVVASL